MTSFDDDRAWAGSAESSSSPPVAGPRFVSLRHGREPGPLVLPQGCTPTRSALSPAGCHAAVARRADTASWKDHEFRNPEQPIASERRKRRRFVYELLDGLRPHSSRRVGGCCRKRIALEVEVLRKKAKRRDGGTCEQAYFRGLLRCGSVWECPVCALRIRAARAEELRFAVEQWGPKNVAMLSLTVRHGLGDDLRQVRRGLADSFRKLINGNPWKRFSDKFGLQHHVRSVEVTHGAHGWHPHLHILFFLEVKLSEDEQAEASAWLQARWARCVRKALGAEFVPNEHGVDLRESKRADYLAKVSFELTDPGTKRARGKNRTPLDIASSAASGNNEADAALWVSYCEGMRGAKMLTWSRGLREFVGLDDETTDQEVAEAEEAQVAEPVATIPSAAWDALRRKRGMACAILEAAELIPSPAEAAKEIQALIWAAGPRVPP